MDRASCDQISDLLDAYLLGMLAPMTAAAVERHLAACPDCRAMADALSDAAAALPLALGQVSPLRLPPALKERVLAALSEAPAAEPGADQAAGRPLRVVSVPLSAARRDRSPGRVGPTVGWFGHRLRLLAGAAATLALLASLAWNVQLSVTLAEERAWRADLAALAEQQEIVFEVIDSPRASKVILRSPTPGGTAYGKLFTRPDLPHVVVMAARLSQPPAGQSYHLWLTRAGRTELVGSLAVNELGFAQIVFDADQPGPTYDAALVTLQPDSATAPSETVILRWERAL